MQNYTFQLPEMCAEMIKFKILYFCNKVAKVYLCVNGSEKSIIESQLGCAWYQCILGLCYSLRTATIVSYIIAFIWNKHY